MKNLNNKLLLHIKNHNHIIPNICQKKVITRIEYELDKVLNNKILNIFKKNFLGIYIHGSFGVGKSVILKALNVVFKDSEIFHFSDLIFHIQNTKTKKKTRLNAKIILIDEFYINNLTNLILFKEFLFESFHKKKIIIMTGNKKITNIYEDPVNKKLCHEIREELDKNFVQLRMFSKVDYRDKEKVDHNFFFINKKRAHYFQNKLRKQISITSVPRQIKFRRKGLEFSLDNYFGNLIDISFDNFFEKKLVFQDYSLIAKKIKIFFLRDIPKLTEEKANHLSRFIHFVDVYYENKNILSISTEVELDKLYAGKRNVFDFKRTISRLKEMGSNTYINNNIRKLLKN